MNHFWTAALFSTVFTSLFQVAANAATFRFDTDPFAGSPVLTTPGRQFVGNELFIPNFSIAEDEFSFDPSAFGVANLFFLMGWQQMCHRMVQMSSFYKTVTTITIQPPRSMRESLPI